MVQDIKSDLPQVGLGILGGLYPGIKAARVRPVRV